MTRARRRPPTGSPQPPRCVMLRLAPDDYDRLSALAADEGLAVGSKARELMISAMDPQIFGERYHDVERLLRSVVKKEMETHAERLHKRLYRVGGMTRRDGGLRATRAHRRARAGPAGRRRALAAVRGPRFQVHGREADAADEHVGRARRRRAVVHAGTSRRQGALRRAEREGRGAHAVYIATRPGTDLTVTADSVARMARREISDDATYTRYIAERPGVVADGEAHGLFDEDGVPDLASSPMSSRRSRQAPVYRVIVSVNRSRRGRARSGLQGAMGAPRAGEGGRPVQGHRDRAREPAVGGRAPQPGGGPPARPHHGLGQDRQPGQAGHDIPWRLGRAYTRPAAQGPARRAHPRDLRRRARARVRGEGLRAL